MALSAPLCSETSRCEPAAPRTMPLTDQSGDPVPPPALASLLPPHWKEEVGRWFAQDIPKWDVGGFVVGDEPHHAMLLGKERA